ncbi:MAG: corrinoid protein [Chloroflexi bacterium]|jgi:5-methyltetrahydrofolate--homocysteine methyltransferase|nr:corrinoid protein [Chloroflexota bacterium]MBT4004411.1 corrinoid protein [Chloroflexota bacterium]MBT4306620.1 corrinoid protein [Chloroflexota bacterium]MBT4533887.1 corrinoid protein [Chloroflexota bacterium]MBT4681893.1 corrinoid protein [Chloroflexota bacterium]
MKEIFELIYEGVKTGNLDAVRTQVQAAIDGEVSPEAILKEALIPPMEEVGQLFEEGEFFVPEMLIAARAMQAGLELIKPLLIEADVESEGRVVLGTVKGDLHDIGKNLVGMMLEGAGFDVIDLGTDVGPDSFVDAVKEGDVDIIGMSALLTTTMPQMEATVQALIDAGIRDKVKVMIGGAPVTAEYSERIGVDGFAEDASKAVKIAKSVLE